MPDEELPEKALDTPLEVPTLEKGFDMREPVLEEVADAETTAD